MSNQPPIEVPQGAIRLNTDSQKLEFFAQDRWYEMATDSPTLDGGARGVIAGNNPTSNVIQFFTIPIQGNATDFGDLSQNRFVGGSGSSRTRGIFMGGDPGPSSRLDDIDFITIASTGNATDFGDLTVARGHGCGTSNQTRCCMMGGSAQSGNQDVIDFITTASTGNAVDFGNLIEATEHAAGASSPTRGLVGGGNPGVANRIQFITISTTGNASDFGDLLGLGDVMMGGGMASPIRAIFSGNYTNKIESVTIASGGNANDFGTMTANRGIQHSNTDSIRGVISGGRPSDPASNVNTMEYIQIMTEGNGVDFGDLVAATANGFDTVSSAHGGL